MCILDHEFIVVISPDISVDFAVLREHCIDMTRAGRVYHKPWSDGDNENHRVFITRAIIFGVHHKPFIKEESVGEDVL